MGNESIKTYTLNPYGLGGGEGGVASGEKKDVEGLRDRVGECE